MAIKIILISALKKVDSVIGESYNNTIKGLWKISGSVSVVALSIDI